MFELAHKFNSSEYNFKIVLGSNGWVQLGIVGLPTARMFIEWYVCSLNVCIRWKPQYVALKSRVEWSNPFPNGTFSQNFPKFDPFPITVHQRVNFKNYDEGLSAPDECGDTLCTKHHHVNYLSEQGLKLFFTIEYCRTFNISKENYE